MPVTVNTTSTCPHCHFLLLNLAGGAGEGFGVLGIVQRCRREVSLQGLGGMHSGSFEEGVEGRSTTLSIVSSFVAVDLSLRDA